MDFSHFEQSYSNVPTSAADDYIFSPHDLKKGYGLFQNDKNLQQLREDREPTIGDEEEEDIGITVDVDGIDIGSGQFEDGLLPPLTPRDEPAQPRESNPIAI